jgi:hypothetical protein
MCKCNGGDGKLRRSHLVVFPQNMSPKFENNIMLLHFIFLKSSLQFVNKIYEMDISFCKKLLIDE